MHLLSFRIDNSSCKYFDKPAIIESLIYNIFIVKLSKKFYLINKYFIIKNK